MKPLLSHYRYNNHPPRYSRRMVGYGPVSCRPIYAYAVVCKCGWTLKWNEGKAETLKAWREHSREEWIKEFGR